MIILHDTITNETMISRNSVEDDFLKFIVKGRDLQPAQLKIYITSKTRDDADMKGRLHVSEGQLQVLSTDYTGSAETDDFVITGESLAHTHALQELSYPYDENGKFNQSLWGL